MAISDKLEHLLETKQAIKTAIQGKGQSVSDTDTFRSYADKINAITTGGGGETDETLKELVEGTLTELNDTAGSITKVGAYAFYSNPKLTKINLPNASYISAFAFASASYLSSVSIPQCDIVRGYAFKNCGGLRNVYAPNCITISQDAFYSCTNLESANFPLCELVESNAFAMNYRLSEMSFPICKEIQTDAFRSCSQLQRVYLPLCEIVGTGVFARCSALSSINMPNIRSVSANVLFGTQIKEVYLPECEMVYGQAFPTDATYINLPICRGVANYGVVTYASTIYSLPACITLASRAFCNCSLMQSLSLPLCTWFRYSSVLFSCKALSALYLGRKCTLDYASTFYSTPMSNSSYLGYFGSIYVRSRDLSWYQSATNWATYSSRITTYEPEEDLLDEIGNFVASGISLTTMLENCEVGDNLIAGVFSVGIPTVNEGWNLISQVDNIVSSSTSYKMYVYTKVATSTIESITVEQATAGRLYANIVNMKNKTPNLVSELNNLYDITDDETVIITKPNSNEMLLFVGAALANTYGSPYSLKGDYDYEYTYGQQSRLTMIHTTKEQGSQMRFRFMTNDKNSLGVIGIELT